MSRLFVSLWGVAFFAVAGPAGAQQAAPTQLPRIDVESDPLENPEAFGDLWDRYGGDGPLGEPVTRVAPVDENTAADEKVSADETGNVELPAVAAPAVASSAASASVDAESDAAIAEPAEIPPVQPRTLSPEMQQLRDRVRSCLGEQMGQDYNVDGNTATDVLYFCLAFGRRAGVRTNNRTQPVSGVGCLCFNYAFRGYRLLTADDDRLVARVGYGRQAYPSQLFAVLAQSRVAPDYPVRAGGLKASVGDLVATEKLSCRETSDLSLKLVGLSYYVTSDETWVSSDGETWSLERVVRAEMDRPFTQASGSGVHRLMGLSHAVQRRIKDELPVDGSFARAQRYLNKFHDHALQLQNSNGSWHPKAFRARGLSPDTAGTLRATGMILDWLVFSLPADRLEDRRVVRSVEFLTRQLGSGRYATGTSQLPTHEISGVMHAVRALRVYDERVFKSADPAEGRESMASRSESPAGR